MKLTGLIQPRKELEGGRLDGHFRYNSLLTFTSGLCRELLLVDA